MSDIALNKTGTAGNVGGIELNKAEENEIIDQKTSELQDKLTSQDNIEKLGAKRGMGKVGRILLGIAGGLLLGAGIVAAVAATVTSMGLAPAVLGGIAATIGGVTGASITAGVAGAAGIGCIAGSIASGRSAESFVEGQNSKHSSKDNLAMITGGKVGGKINLEQLRAENAKTEKFFGLTRQFKQDPCTQSELLLSLENKCDIGKVNIIYIKYSKIEALAEGIDVSDPMNPKISKDEDNKLTPKAISDFVKNLLGHCRTQTYDYSKDNIALVRYALNFFLSRDEETKQEYKNLEAMNNPSFVDKLYKFVDKEMKKIENSDQPLVALDYKMLSIFKSALKLTDEDIQKLEELEKNPKAQIPDEDDE